MKSTMRAIVLDGQVRVVPDYPVPRPKPNECLVRVSLVGVCTTDLELAKGYMNFRGVLGHEFVGVVEQSPDAGLLGKRVVCEINCVCGRCDMCQAGLASHCRNRTVIGIAGRDGCFAEFIAVPADNCHVVPEAVRDEQAVFVEPLAAALQVVRQAPIDPAMKVSVIGDGRLGLLVAQVLAARGVAPLLLGRHDRKLAFAAARSIRTARIDQFRPQKSDDVVVECSGRPAGLELAMQMVRPRGLIVLKSTYAAGEPVNLAPLVIDEIQLIGSRCGPFRDALEMLTRGEVDVAVMISKRFGLDEALVALAEAKNPDNVKVLIDV